MNQPHNSALAPVRAPEDSTPEAVAPAPPSPAEAELARLVAAAAGGAAQAWDALVRRLEPKLRAVARSYRLSASDIDDVVQMTWIKLFEHIHELRNPAALGAWLKTTVRRSALAALQRPVREVLSDDPTLGDGADADGPEQLLI